MKLIRKLAIICVIALLCNIFAIIPANAFSNEIYESETWELKLCSGGSQASVPAQWHTESTVDDFDDYLHINPQCTAMSHQKYDLNNVKIVLNTLTIPNNTWMSLTFSPDGIATADKKSNSSSGLVCLRIYKDTTNEKLTVKYLNEDGAEQDVCSVGLVDEFEFEFLRRTDITYSGTNATNSHKFTFRVNQKYNETSSSASWITKFMKSASFSSSKINLSAQSYFKANVKVSEKSYFTEANKNGLKYSNAINADGYQNVYAEKSTYTLASSVTHNMFDEALILNDINWLIDDAAININFSSTYRYNQASLLASAQNLGLVIKKNADGNFNAYINGTQVSEIAVDSFEALNPLTIRFTNDGAGGYGILFGDYYFENTNITTFLAAGSGENSYVSISAEGSFSADVKFANAEEKMFVSNNWAAPVEENVLESGEILYSVSAKTTLTTLQKINLLGSILVIDNANFGVGEQKITIGFSSKHIKTSDSNSATNGRLKFELTTQNDENGVCTGISMGTTVLPVADSYYISLCKQGSNYYLKINDSLLSSSAITTFCKKYQQGYITVFPSKNAMEYSLDVWDFGPGFTITSDKYSVTDATVASVVPYSSANDLIKNLDVTSGYKLKVTTKDNEERTYADLLATEDKLVVTYKGRNVASIDIAVGGDLTGDAKIKAQDIVDLKKTILGISKLANIYNLAADSNNDGTTNVLDYIYTQKTILDTEDKMGELVSLVDFAVEVESGKEPVVLQLTDTLILDAAQSRKSDTLSSYQKTFWATNKAEQNCYSYIRETIEETDPDLIVISGNMVYGEFDDNGTAFQNFVNFMDSFDIPWAPVFGEHDNESKMGADWQSDVLENAENCLFKQRNLTGNGNYTVGIIQNNKLLRVFYMLDSNGCANASKASLANKHTKTTAGFAEDQINWYTKLINKTEKVSPDTKISFVYGIQQASFEDAFQKYGFDNKTTKATPINLNKTVNCAESDIGYIGADLKNAWDSKDTVFNGMKALGVDSVFVGGEAANNASVVYEGVRFQYGQKSSSYGYYNNVLNDGTVKALYPENNEYTPLIGGTAIPISYNDGSITNPYIYYCDEAGGNINFAKKATLYVKDFGTVGDGVTDDGDAIYDAMEAFMKCGAGSTLVFEKNKTYYVADNSDRNSKALNFKNMYKGGVEGNGATILVGKEMAYMSVSKCVDFEISGLNFNREITSHFVGTVISKEGTSYVQVKSDRNIDFSGSYTPSKSMFAFALNSSGRVERKYLHMSKLETVNAEERTYLFYPNNSDSQHNTSVNFGNLNVGDKIVIPTPYIGHSIDNEFVVSGNDNLTLSNIDVYNAAEFVFFVTTNPGDITFDDVDIVAPESETTGFVSWRDGFHCKTNRGSISWKNCKAVGLGDDIINISCRTLYVTEVVSSNEIKCYCNETKGKYGDVPVGSQIEIYDVDSGKLIGETTITDVIDADSNHYVLADSLSGLKAGTNIRVNIITDAAPDSLVTACDFEGTLRFKGAGGIVENTKLNLYSMMMYPESNIEGPIPRNTTFRNCDFTGTRDGAIKISCLSTVLANYWREGYYRIKDIKFENCTGLTKAMFVSSYGNFNSWSVNYITVTPAIK